MNGKGASNDKIYIKGEKLISFQPNLFADKKHIKELRLFDDIVFSGDRLFGKEDAFLEDIEILKSYAIERNDCDSFYDTNTPLVILCAPKGTGKTTLCKLWEDDLSKHENNITLMPNYTQLTGFGNIYDFAEISNSWKRLLLNQILAKLTDGNILIASKLTDGIKMNERNKTKLDICDFLIKSIEDHDSFHTTSSIVIIEKIKQLKGKTIWLFLDEFDADFTKEPSSSIKLAALLNAARDLSTEFINVKVRITIRPNVWATLRSSNPLMSNFKELILFLEWSHKEIKSILAKRIERYINSHTNFDKLNWDFVDFSKTEKEDWLIAQIFDTEKFDLGKGNRPPEIVLAKLCADRPRWVIELCKSACKIKRNRSGVILMKDIENSFREIGTSRLSDITSEYAIYCPQVNEILNAFYNAKGSYDLVGLIAFTEQQIVSKIDIEILGVSKKCTAKQVVNFLYELTFVEPLKILVNKGVKKKEFLHYKDYPDLLETEITNNNIEYDLYWKVHPAFRNYLNIGTPSNFELE